MKPGIKLLVINDVGIVGGGTEKRIRELLQFLRDNRYVNEIHLLQQNIYPTPKENVFPRLTIFPGLIIHLCPPGHIASFLYTLRLLKKESFDLIQAHNMMGLTPAPLLAAKLKKIPIVFYAHDFWPVCGKRNFIDPYNAMQEQLCDKPTGGSCTHCTNYKGKIKLLLWKKLLNLSHAGVCSSNIMKNLFERDALLKGKWNVVVPWIDQSVYKPRKVKINNTKTKNEHTILFVGSLIDFKGAWVLVKAMKKIIQEFPDAKLLIVGSEQEQGNVFRKKIDDLLKSDETAHHVFFLGKKTPEQIYKELCKATVAVCPTVCFEGFGLTWAEAMMAGVPVIASNIGTIPEYIQHHQTGILFQPRDHLALADAVISLFSDEKKAELLSQQAICYSKETFNLTHSGEQIIKIYEATIFVL